MKEIKLNTRSKQFLGDTLTPVEIYLKMRDVYPNVLLLESSDYHGDEHSYSYICGAPIAKFVVNDGIIRVELPGEKEQEIAIKDRGQVLEELNKFRQAFDAKDQEVPFITGGLFGYTTFDGVKYFEELDIKTFPNDDRKIPEMMYQVFSIVIAKNHFDSQIHVFEHLPSAAKPILEEVMTTIKRNDFATYDFKPLNNETSNYTDEEFLDIIQKGKDHCQRGDVFQIVLSRRFQQGYLGDEFNVYRRLRSINPSPYLFYFDYGDFSIMGSSPEAQIVIKNDKASIFPIAGTFKRTGNDREDYDLAKKLFDDPKESSEHVMLVDLARNDLSRHGDKVKVETFKEIQYYSHVIHMVSKVSGTLEDAEKSLQVVADTFPAGTLSGAPKHMAIQLIDKYENENRGYYGGAIGYLGFDGEFNHAIMIRTILRKGKTLFYQAGAGVVAKSVTESELQEVNNKLAALKKAIEMASNI